MKNYHSDYMQTLQYISGGVVCPSPPAAVLEAELSRNTKLALGESLYEELPPRLHANTINIAGGVVCPSPPAAVLEAELSRNIKLALGESYMKNYPSVYIQKL